MSDSISDYQDAVQALTAARSNAEALVKTVTHAADVLKTWRTVLVANTGPGIGFPAELAFGRSPSIDARNWPTGDDIARALAGFHEAKRSAENAYATIPAEQRAVVVAPPKD